MKYIILYLTLENGDHIPNYNVVSSKEDIAKFIEKAKKDYLACNFRIFELGSEITEEGVFELCDDISNEFKRIFPCKESNGKTKKFFTRLNINTIKILKNEIQSKTRKQFESRYHGSQWQRLLIVSY